MRNILVLGLVLGGLTGAISGAMAAPLAPGTAQAQSQCLVVTQREAQGPLKVLHFRNVCKFAVWAITKNRETGQYSVHEVKPGAVHEDVGEKSFPDVVGWCRLGNVDCLREWGLK